MKRMAVLIYLLCMLTRPLFAQTQEEENVIFFLADLRREVAAANQSLAARWLDVAISSAQARAERGAFEPAFVGRASSSSTKRLNTVEETLSQNDAYFDEQAESGAIGVEGALPLGLQYWLGTSIEQAANNLTNRYNTIPYTDEYVGFAGVRVTKPLLRGGYHDPTHTRIRLADADVKVQQQVYRRVMMEVVSRAELAYWDLALARHMHSLRWMSVRTAEKVLQDNRERVQAGKMSEIELLEAESGLAKRSAQARHAGQQVLAAQNVVRSFITTTTAFDSRPLLVPCDKPALEDLNAEFGTAMQQALRLHPDYLAQTEVIKKERIRLAFQKEQRWPQLDLIGSYGLNGLGDSFDNSYEQLGEGDEDVWSVSLELRIPLGAGIRERAECRASRMKHAQALIDLKATEIGIANVLNTVLHRVQSTKEQAAQVQVVVDVQSRLLESEMQRLDVGKSNSRRVLDIEQELAETRIAHYQSLVEHRKAWLEWELAQGSLLEARNMEPVFNGEGAR